MDDPGLGDRFRGDETAAWRSDSDLWDLSVVY